MNEAQLRERLAELHEELEGGPEVSGETRRLLETVTDDIHQMMKRAEAASADEHHSFIERLRHATWNLEESHPRLTTAVRQLIDALTSPFQ